jgi:hypothetical protein
MQMMVWVVTRAAAIYLNIGALVVELLRQFELSKYIRVVKNNDVFIRQAVVFY